MVEECLGLIETADRAWGLPNPFLGAGAPVEEVAVLAREGQAALGGRDLAGEEDRRGRRQADDPTLSKADERRFAADGAPSLTVEILLQGGKEEVRPAGHEKGHAADRHPVPRRDGGQTADHGEDDQAVEAA